MNASGRPTWICAPDKLQLTEADQRKLYDLIWKRTLASQMAAARLERTTVDVGIADGQVVLRATGQVVLFDGFLKVYAEGRDEPATMPPSEDEDDDAAACRRSCRAKPAGEAQSRSTLGEQHFTQPPPRYTEATLVKRMEELGIGRPSTYASIVTTIQEREYVRKDQNRLIPEDKGRLVTVFLMNYFARYVGYDFTADLEDELDDISAGDARLEGRAGAVLARLLGRGGRDRRAAHHRSAGRRSTRCWRRISIRRAPTAATRGICPVCGEGRLNLKTARSGGAFIGCSNYPELPLHPRPRRAGRGRARPAPTGSSGRGSTATTISLRSGRFGPYVQRGEATEEPPKPPRASLPKGWEPAEMTLEKALQLLTLPRPIGPHPEDGEMIEAGIGRYGPYVKHGARLCQPARGRRGLRPSA